MEERTSYLIVGAFLLGTVFLMIGLTAWFGSGAGQEPMARYLVFFDRDVSGLTPGSPVRYLGVDVGQVTSISLVPDNARTVKVQIDVAQTTPVDTGTYAGLAFQGVTGVAFINMGVDLGEHRPIQTTPGSAYPVIPSRSVGVAALLADAPQLVGLVNDVLARVGNILGETNQASLAQTLVNLEELTGALASRREQIAAIPQQIDGVLVNLDRATQQLPELLTQVQPELVAAAQNLNRTTEQLVKLTGRIDEWLEQNDGAVRSFINDGLGATPALVADARKTIRELEKLVTELRDNPSQLVHRPRVLAVSVEP